MPEVSLPWGDQEINISLPARWTIEQMASPSLRPASDDWPVRLAEAINRPVAGLPLEKLLSARRAGRVCIVVEDVTRHSPLPQILDVVLREVRHAEIENDRIEIFLAAGMHQAPTDAEVSAKLGAVADGIARRCNPWEDASQYTSVGRVGAMDVELDRGVLNADLRIVISSVNPHLQAGFGGGYKMFLPGCASLETIRRLHQTGLSRRDVQRVGIDVEHNPMRCAIDQAGQLIDSAAGKTFAVQYVLDAANRPAFIAAGDMLPAHRMAAKQCAVACGIVTGTPADVLLVNAHPLDYDLWQSFKCIANTRWAARPDGPIICMTRCLAGLGGMKVPRWPISPRWTRRLLGWLGPAAISSLVTRAIPRLAGDAAFFVRMAAQTLHRNPILMVAPTLHEAGLSFPGVQLFATPEDALAAADAMLGEGTPRVTIFPQGGTTFPIPPQTSATV